MSLRMEVRGVRVIEGGECGEGVRTNEGMKRYRKLVDGWVHLHSDGAGS